MVVAYAIEPFILSFIWILCDFGICFAEITNKEKSECNFFESNYFMTLEQLITQTLAGLNYELVDVERSGNGLMTVFIDHIDYEEGKPIMIDDCEAASRQLTYVFEVENVGYDRLEVSSPGMNRPLRKLSDYARFAGLEANIKLKLSVDGRKNFTGKLQEVNEAADENAQLGLVFEDDGAEQLLEFGLADVDKARLVPVYNFKGKQK